jgi:hypothetical protein
LNNGYAHDDQQMHQCHQREKRKKVHGFILKLTRTKGDKNSQIGILNFYPFFGCKVSGVNVINLTSQFLVRAASSREKKALIRHHRMFAAGCRSHNLNRINYHYQIYSTFVIRFLSLSTFPIPNSEFFLLPSGFTLCSLPHALCFNPFALPPFFLET